MRGLRRSEPLLLGRGARPLKASKTSVWPRLLLRVRVTDVHVARSGTEALSSSGLVALAAARRMAQEAADAAAAAEEQAA